MAGSGRQMAQTIRNYTQAPPQEQSIEETEGRQERNRSPKMVRAQSAVLRNSLPRKGAPPPKRQSMKKVVD